MLSDLFGEEEGWCEGCVMVPCICILSKIELKITEEKERRLRKGSQISPAPIETTTSPTTPTTTSSVVPTSSTGEAKICAAGGSDCIEEKEVELLPGKKTVLFKEVRGSEKSLSSPTTTTPRNRRTRMKAPNNNIKKVTRMTDKEREEVRRNTKDIRGFFMKGEEVTAGPGLVQRLIKAAETNSLSTTTTQKEVSSLNISNNSVVPSMMKSNNTPVVVVDDPGMMKRLGERQNDVAKKETDGPASKDARRQKIGTAGPSMRGNTRLVCGAGLSLTRRGEERQDTFEGGRLRRGGIHDVTACSYSKPNVLGSVDDDTSTEVSDVCVYDCVRGEYSSVVRSVVHDDSQGTSRDRLRGGGVVVHDGGKPGGGVEGGSSSNPLMTKPNRVTGGLQGRIHMWEQKTGSTRCSKQGEIHTEDNSEGESRVQFSGRNRKDKKVLEHLNTT